MVQAIIFDLDGVLVDSKEIHFNALNLALAKFDKNLVISKLEQSSVFEGLTTKSKLEILTHTKGLDPNLYNEIWNLKQEYSASMFSSLSIDEELVTIMRFIKLSNVKIGVASNSIRRTLDSCLSSLGISPYIDCSLSNEDVYLPKPDKEIYVKSMECLQSTPTNTIIFEDSPIGLAAARNSTATVVKVRSRSEITIELILNLLTDKV